MPTVGGAPSVHLQQAGLLILDELRRYMGQVPPQGLALRPGGRRPLPVIQTSTVGWTRPGASNRRSAGVQSLLERPRPHWPTHRLLGDLVLSPRHAGSAELVCWRPTRYSWRGGLFSYYRHRATSAYARPSPPRPEVHAHRAAPVPAFLRRLPEERLHGALSDQGGPARACRPPVRALSGGVPSSRQAIVAAGIGAWSPCSARNPGPSSPLNSQVRLRQKP